MTFGEELKLKRKQSGRTLREVATLLDIKPSELLYIEHDRLKPSGVILKKLEKLYGPISVPPSMPEQSIWDKKFDFFTKYGYFNNNYGI